MKDAGIVKQHIYLAEGLKSLFDRVATILGLAHVGANKQGLAALVCNLFDDLLATFGITPGDRDRCTLACMQSRYRYPMFPQ